MKINPFLVALGGAIRNRRVSNGLSQEKLAEVCGLHRTYISLVESGKRNPIFTNLVAIAIGLKTTISKLTEEID